MERRIWRVEVVIEATQAEAEQAVNRIERALCPDPNHEGSCPLPWTISLSEMDHENQADWKASFDEERP